MTNVSIVYLESIAAPVQATTTVSHIKTELPIETEVPQKGISNEKTEVELLSNQNDSKSDEEDPLMAFSPVTDSGKIQIDSPSLLHSLLNYFCPLFQI